MNSSSSNTGNHSAALSTPEIAIKTASVASDSMAEEEAELKGTASANASSAKQDDSVVLTDDEDDEEVRLAMEMALAAAHNPTLKPDELRKLVGEKNQQLKIVNEIEKEQQIKREKELEREHLEAQKRWDEKKQTAVTWLSNTASAAAQAAADLKFEAEKQYYADEIKQDKKIIAIRKRMKVCRKTIKAHRLQGNRVETRHSFKRQRMEKLLMQVDQKLKKQHRLLTHSAFGVQEYAKAMMKASKKWKKKGTKEELSLEAQLCRNMHQMLAIEKQRSKLKKSTREVKKYLQRCKSWLSDKKAFCEMHIMTLDSTAASMQYLYKETLEKQDKLILRMKTLEEFQGVDLANVQEPKISLLEKAPGPSAMLNALRGLPFSDSVRIKKGVIDRKILIKEDDGDQVDPNTPYLTIDANDDCSVSSHLTDPDSGLKDEEIMAEMEAANNDEDSVCEFDFGTDAPWMKSGAVTDSGSSSGDEAGKHGAARKKRGGKKEDAVNAPEEEVNAPEKEVDAPQPESEKQSSPKKNPGAKSRKRDKKERPPDEKKEASSSGEASKTRKSSKAPAEAGPSTSDKGPSAEVEPAAVEAAENTPDREEAVALKDEPIAVEKVDAEPEGSSAEVEPAVTEQTEATPAHEEATALEDEPDAVEKASDPSEEPEPTVEANASGENVDEGEASHNADNGTAKPTGENGSEEPKDPAESDETSLSGGTEDAAEEESDDKADD